MKRFIVDLFFSGSMNFSLRSMLWACCGKHLFYDAVGNSIPFFSLDASNIPPIAAALTKHLADHAVTIHEPRVKSVHRAMSHLLSSDEITFVQACQRDFMNSSIRDLREMIEFERKHQDALNVCEAFYGYDLEFTGNTGNLIVEASSSENAVNQAVIQALRLSYGGINDLLFSVKSFAEAPLLTYHDMVLSHVKKVSKASFLETSVESFFPLSSQLVLALRSGYFSGNPYTDYFVFNTNHKSFTSEEPGDFVLRGSTCTFTDAELIEIAIRRSVDVYRAHLSPNVVSLLRKSALQKAFDGKVKDPEALRRDMCLTDAEADLLGIPLKPAV